MSVVILFEGIDGSGKTTQLNLLKNTLEKQNYKVCVLSNPGYNDFSRDLKELIFKYASKISTETECFLFLANHENLITEVERLKNEDEYDFILIDRFAYTTAAYQYGYYNYVIEDFINTNEDIIDFIVYLESSCNLKKERIPIGRDEIETRDDEYYKQALEVYDNYFRGNEKAIIINASAPIELIQNHIHYKLYELKYI